MNLASRETNNLKGFLRKKEAKADDAADVKFARNHLEFFFNIFDFGKIRKAFARVNGYLATVTRQSLLFVNWK